MPLLTVFSQHISDVTGAPFQVRQQHSVGGGCINSAHIVEDGQQRYFVKTNAFHKSAMFTAEAAGLQAILASNTVRAPRPICHGASEDHAYLVLEYIELANGRAHSAAALGEQLAAMHRVSVPRYGWGIDNTIGATPQVNTWSSDWVHFYGEYRLRFQIDLAARNGCSIQAKGEKLIDRLAVFFAAYQPKPALLHGDLWGRNWGEDSRGKPVIYDPALYYGDREADIAMTELFGGYPPSFYASYDANYPRDSGYAARKDLYNLYHILNHFNLFGGGYGSQAERMINRLLAEIG